MDKAKKKRIKRYITWLCIAALVLGLTVMPLIAQNEAEADGPQASILSAVAQQGSIRLGLHGGGTLETKGQEDVQLPSGVKITQFYVKNGDVVTAGDPLAQVDKVSVMTAITQVSQSMEYLREKLEDAREQEAAEEICAAAGGRVKKIFAAEGESVQEVMLRDGCLAVLSLDGMMAVRLEADSPVRTGETVTVTLADGTDVPGRVESNLDGVVVITLEDEGYAIGMEVTAQGLGQGSLYIHNAWKATSYSGTISKIHAQEEQTLSSGGKLFSLMDGENTGEMQRRANQHREYEQQLQVLLKLYQTGTITAPCDGVVSGVDENSPSLLSAAGEWKVSGLNSTQERGYRIQLLSSITYSCSGSDACQAEPEDHAQDCPMKCIESKAQSVDCPARKHSEDCIEFCTHAGTEGACQSKVHYSDCIDGCTGDESCQSDRHKPGCIQLCISSDGSRDCPALNHRRSCIERCKRADTTGVCDADEHHHHLDCIESCTGSTSAGESCPAAKHQDGCYYKDVDYEAQAAMVTGVATAEGKLLVRLDTATRYSAQKGNTQSGWSISPSLVKTNFLTPGEVLVADTAKYQAGDILLLITGYKNDVPVLTDVVVYEHTSSGSGIPGGSGLPSGGGSFDWSGMLGGSGMSGMSGLAGMIGGFSGFGSYSYGGAAQEDEGLYDLEGSVLVSVTPQETMTLKITLDEQDIARVQTGMTASVKIEALRGEAFPAVVTKVAGSGVNSGGSSKFTVELTLEAREDMIAGMSATVQIPMEVRENVLTIPVSALSEQNGKAVVYTALDEKTGLPGAPVPVQTGASDGEYVEVISGLKAGDTVYYSYYDILELDTSAEAERFTFR